MGKKQHNPIFSLQIALFLDGHVVDADEHGKRWQCCNHLFNSPRNIRDHALEAHIEDIEQMPIPSLRERRRRKKQKFFHTSLEQSNAPAQDTGASSFEEVSFPASSSIPFLLHCVGESWSSEVKSPMADVGSHFLRTIGCSAVADMFKEDPVSVILFYCYVRIACPEDLALFQQSICSLLNLSGKLRIAKEGINGTLGGNLQEICKYVAVMQHESCFNDRIAFKFSLSENVQTPFDKLSVKICDEIVPLGIDPSSIRSSEGGQHLDPQEFHKQLIENRNNTVLIDCRNHYEWRLGRFPNAFLPNTRKFSDFPSFVNDNATALAGKKILMYCTGGIRCERASAYVKKVVANADVYQLNGGIHRYMQELGDNSLFQGKNYVFDNRLSLSASDISSKHTPRCPSETIARCSGCAQPFDEYQHCLAPRCRQLVLWCEACRTLSVSNSEESSHSIETGDFIDCSYAGYCCRMCKAGDPEGVEQCRCTDPDYRKAVLEKEVQLAGDGGVVLSVHL